uniref:non-specific serine/threonine protein kinase n=1 Tax=Cacopsylla melanoneura TaxID=428564 RepID=A0A8D8SGC1_9HEMI
MAPRKLAKENASEEVKPLRVLRPKLQVVPENNFNSENKMEEKVDKRKKATKTEGTDPKATKTATKPEPKAKGASKPKKVAAKGHKLPDPIKPGTVFTDSAKQLWKVGKSLGSGGFGEVYSASDNLNEKIDNYKYVMKVEYSTGPLFVEQNFYIRCSKAEHLEAWKKERKVKAIGLPTFYAMRGQQEHNGNSYRFIIITKFGQDLQHLLEEQKQFSLKNTLTIGCSLVDTLEYIHHSGYVHADLKPANILLGIDSTHAVVNIVDFGLATKYKDTDNNHKAHKEEKKAAHNGTLIYTSLVAHRGAVTTSRICDIEILAYNLLHFYTGSLPWATYEKQPDKVMQMKQELSEDPKKFLSAHYPSVTDMQVFVDLFDYISLSEFEDEPDYNKLKQMFTKALTKSRLKFDGKLNFDEKAKSNETATASASAAGGKKKVAQARGRGKKAAPKVVELHSENEEEEKDEDEEHFDDETLRFVNTNKRRVKATATLNKLQEASEEEEEDEEEPVQQKKKRRNAKQTKAPAPAEIGPSSPEPQPQTTSEVLDETYTIPNPTPAMVAVMKKQLEKKPGPVRNNKASKDKKPEEKTRKDGEDKEVDEENAMDTEAYPTPTMVDVMKKKEEKKTGTGRNNRANKERINEKAEETNQKDEMEEENEMDTESNPTSPMVEVLKKKPEKKTGPGRNNRANKERINEKAEETNQKENWTR